MASVPASIRNKNAGAMYPGPSARKYGSRSFETLRSKDGVHKIATFDDHESGAAAMFDLLASKYTGMTVRAAITRWCGGYYASAYLQVLQRETGVGPDTILSGAMVADPAIAIPLCKAMALQEAGRAYPMSDEQWAVAHGMVFGSKPPIGEWRPEPQVTNDPDGHWSPDNHMPTPKPETRAAEELGQSRKYSLARFWTWLMGGAGTSVMGIQSADQAGMLPGILKIVKQFAVDNAALLAIGGLFAGLLLSETIRHLMRDDISRGAYQPGREP